MISPLSADSFVNSQEWTLSRSVPELKVVSTHSSSLGSPRFSPRKTRVLMWLTGSVRRGGRSWGRQLWVADSCERGAALGSTWTRGQKLLFEHRTLPLATAEPSLPAGVQGWTWRSGSRAWPAQACGHGCHPAAAVPAGDVSPLPRSLAGVSPALALPRSLLPPVLSCPGGTNRHLACFVLPDRGDGARVRQHGVGFPGTRLRGSATTAGRGGVSHAVPSRLAVPARRGCVQVGVAGCAG